MSQGEESTSNEVKTLSLEPDTRRMETNMGRGSSSSLSGPNPSWFTPKRLLVLFCVINLINYVDRGAIASNGVNGTARTCNVTCADGRTMQVAVGRHSTNGTNLICAPSSTASNETCTASSGIQGAFNLNNFEDGVLSSAFMVGLLVASPTFAHLAKSVNPFRLIGVGLSVWTLAVIGCGLSFNFWSITIFRMLVGVGEASFISLAAPFIDDNAPANKGLLCINPLFNLFLVQKPLEGDDNAPANKKTAWLGIFYMCISVGYAIGYIYGGLVGNHFSWRYAFFGEAILMFPFAVLGFFIKPLQLKGFSHAESKKALTSIEIAAVVEEGEALSLKAETGSVKEETNSKSSSMSKCATSGLNQFSYFLKDIKVLLLEKVYIVNVLGYMAYNFVIGAYSYWGPKAGKSIYNMSNADYIFGGVTIVSGVLGTLAGGYALDRLTSTIPNAFKLLCTSTFFGAIFCFSAFCFKSMYVFLALFAIGEVLVFATQGPVNFTSLHCVKPSLRPLSMAMSTVAIHIFGDVPSSPLVGVLQDYVNNWRETALILTSIFFLAAGIWFIGIFLHGVDRFDEESEHPAATAERSNTTPLLEEEATERAEAPALP